MSMITDAQELVSAKGRFGHEIPIYDDGFGPLFIHRDSMGISGIVRARTWEDAYSICEDEFFPEADETIEEIQKEYGFKREHVKMIHPIDEHGYINTSVIRPEIREDYALEGKLQEGKFVRWETVETRDDTPGSFVENELFQEAFGFRPNGPNVKDVHQHGIYAKDLNGDSLELLTPDLCGELGITLEIKDN